MTHAALITLSATLTSQHVPANRLAVSLPVWRTLCRESDVEGVRSGAPDQLHILTSDDAAAAALDALDDALRARAQTVGEFTGGECVVLLPGEGIDGCDAWARATVEELVGEVTVEDATERTTLKVRAGSAGSTDDGWANDAYHLLDRQGFTVAEGIDGCTTWDECSDTDEDGEFVTMRVTGDRAEAMRACEVLAGEGYEGELAD